MFTRASDSNGLGALSRHAAASYGSFFQPRASFSPSETKCFARMRLKSLKSFVCGLELQPIGREAVQMVEDADEGVRRGRLAGVDLGADEVEPARAAPSGEARSRRRGWIRGGRAARGRSAAPVGRSGSPRRRWPGSSLPRSGARMRCPRSADAVSTGIDLAVGAGIWRSFCETDSLAPIPSTAKDLSKKAPHLAGSPDGSWSWF